MRGVLKSIDHMCLMIGNSYDFFSLNIMVRLRNLLSSLKVREIIDTSFEECVIIATQMASGLLEALAEFLRLQESNDELKKYSSCRFKHKDEHIQQTSLQNQLLLYSSGLNHQSLQRAF